MKKLITIALVFVVNIVFCQQSKSGKTDVEKITSFSNVERTYEKDVRLRLIVEKDANCVIKSNHTVVFEEGFQAEDGFSCIVSDDAVTKHTKKNNLFTIYPNPSNSSIFISLTGNQIVKIAVVSLKGEIIFETDTAPTLSYELDVSSFSSGIYILSIETNDADIVIQKFIKE
jgi:ABC-type Fe3+-hydroxamate transport system substrate-binding protein